MFLYFAIFLLLFTSPALAEDLLSVRYIRNYDADTITITIPYERPSSARN